MTSDVMLLLEYKNPYWKNNPQSFLELLHIVEQFKSNSQYAYKLKAAKHKNSHLKAWLDSIIAQHNDEIRDLVTCVYWVLNGLVEAPRCQNKSCNAKLLHKQFNVSSCKQPRYCTAYCANTDQNRIARVNETKRKHKDENPNYLHDIAMKRKETNIKAGHDPNWNNSEKCQQTLKKHAEEDPLFYYSIEQKRKATKVKKGHSPNWHNEQQMVITRYEKNDGVWETEDQIRRKEQTSLDRYGFKSPNQSPVVKQHKKEGCLKKFGVDSYSKTEMYHQQMIAADEQRKKKEHQTKKRRGTFNSSKPEQNVHKFLVQMFGDNDVEHQWMSDEYPFNCDFYIKSIDTYIECNFSWTHGGHWFDESSEYDQEKLKKWRDRGTKFYLNAIETWTVRDVKKRRCAEDNHLKYIVMWSEDYDGLKMQLETLMCSE